MELEQQLSAALAPRRPGPAVRAAVMARLSQDAGRRGPNRWVLSGMVLVVAAAAAMLAMRGFDSPPVAAVAAPVSVVEDAPATAIEDQALPVIAEPVQVAVNEAALPPPPAFRVRLLPLDNEAKGSAAAVVASAYDAFAAGLRMVPGLTLVGTESGAGEKVPGYELKLRGEEGFRSDAVAPGFTLEVQATTVGSDGRELAQMFTGMTGDIAPTCSSPPFNPASLSSPSCVDAVGVASSLLATLRISVFPSDPALQRLLQGRLADQDVEPAERLKALSDLGRLGVPPGGNRNWVRNGLSPAIRDAGVVREAARLAATTADPAIRAQVWYILRGSTDAQLVEPLVASLRDDADEDVQVQALAALTGNFSADPRAQAVLESTAMRSHCTMVCALARRKLEGEAGWRTYVVSSLMDTSRSATARVEALFYAYGLPSSRSYGAYAADGRILRALDDEALRALGTVLPAAAAESPVYARSSYTLVSELALIERPVITDLLLAALKPGVKGLAANAVIDALGRRNSDPLVREALEQYSVNEPDPQLRELAAGALRRAVLATPGPIESGPPRLGVQTDYVKVAPGVPQELVGKLVVERMMFGSAAEKAGMQEGDVLLALDGKSLSSGPHLIEVLDGLAKGVDVDLLVSRDGQTLNLKARF